MNWYDPAARLAFTYSETRPFFSSEGQNLTSLKFAFEGDRIRVVEPLFPLTQVIAD
jgi:hypothetical protein